MRIVVNDIAASTGGAMSVLRDFYTCVCENDYENEWIFLLNDRYFKETDRVKILTLPEVKKSPLRKLWFDLVVGRRYIEALNPDVVLSLQNIITFGVKAPQLVYIHQAIPFQSVKRFSFFRASERKLAVIQHWIGRIIKCSARKSDGIIVQTKWMKTAVCRACRLPEKKVLTALPPVKQMPSEGQLDRTAFFYPTADEVYKNNQCIYLASQLLECRGVEHTVTLTLPPWHSRGCIVCTGPLPFENVSCRYQESVLIFPSYIETFGYPLAEARSAGTLILAADTVFAREVLEGYENAYFFDPFKPDKLADLMEKVCTQKIEKKKPKHSNERPSCSWLDVMEQVFLLGT